MTATGSAMRTGLIALTMNLNVFLMALSFSAVNCDCHPASIATWNCQDVVGTGDFDYGK